MTDKLQPTEDPEPYMWKLLRTLFGGDSSEMAVPSKRLPNADLDESYTMRCGKVVKTDAVFDAWTSGDLNSMLEAIGKKTNLIDRHFLLMNIVDQTYRARNETKMREICRSTSECHISEFPRIAPVLKKDMGGMLPRVTTFQKYATVLTEDGEYKKAIAVCEAAISFCLDDGTKGGYEGRIERIRKKDAWF